MNCDCRKMRLIVEIDFGEAEKRGDHVFHADFKTRTRAQAQLTNHTQHLPNYSLVVFFALARLSANSCACLYALNVGFVWILRSQFRHPWLPQALGSALKQHQHTKHHVLSCLCFAVHEVTPISHTLFAIGLPLLIALHGHAGE